jgi:hypothetical protein
VVSNTPALVRGASSTCPESCTYPFPPQVSQISTRDSDNSGRPVPPHFSQIMVSPFVEPVPLFPLFERLICHCNARGGPIPSAIIPNQNKPQS